jgi:hypothetical protein
MTVHIGIHGPIQAVHTCTRGNRQHLNCMFPYSNTRTHAHTYMHVHAYIPGPNWHTWDKHTHGRTCIHTWAKLAHWVKHTHGRTCIHTWAKLAYLGQTHTWTYMHTYLGQTSTPGSNTHMHVHAYTPGPNWHTWVKHTHICTYMHTYLGQTSCSDRLL